MTSSPVKPWMPLVANTLPAPHFKYSPVVRAEPFIFVSGLVGLSPESGALVTGGMAAETMQILDNVSNLCEELNLPLENLMLARVYCADFSQFGVINEVWEKFFQSRTPPARTSVGVAALPLGALIEMEFQFVINAES